MGWPAWHTNGLVEETGSELLRHLVVLEAAQISQEKPPACPMAVVKAGVMAKPWVIKRVHRETVSFYHRNNISALAELQLASCREGPECWGCAVLSVDAVFDFQPPRTLLAVSWPGSCVSRLASPRCPHGRLRAGALATALK